MGFGRGIGEHFVPVGCTDMGVSRRHGEIRRVGSYWHLINFGRRPIAFPDGSYAYQGDQVELKPRYYALRVHPAGGAHLLEVRIATGAANPSGPDRRYLDKPTDDPPYELDGKERLVVTCLAQRYLRGDPQPQPLPWSQVIFELNDLQPEAEWNFGKVTRVVAKLRHRRGIWADDVPSPIGNTLNHKLITELLITAVITPADLQLIGG